MNGNGLYYFVEGIAVTFFGTMGVLNVYHHKNRLRFILGCILLFWMAQHLVTFFFTEQLLRHNEQVSALLNCMDMTAVPTCAFLLLELCKPGWLTPQRVITHISLFLIPAVGYWVSGVEMVYTLFIGFALLYGVGITVTVSILIPRYNRFLRSHYSYDEGLNLRWLYAVLGAFIVLLSLWLVCCIFNRVLTDSIYIIGSLTGWGMICYFIFRQESILDEMKATKKEEEEMEQTAPAEPQIDVALIEKLIEHRFLRPKLYLNPSLKLGDMAAELGTNRTYLSNYLNTTLGISFYDYINSLRLDYATEALKNSDEPLTSIAARSGFNSYSTFRRVFLAKYGMSPSEYRNSHPKQNIEDAPN